MRIQLIEDTVCPWCRIGSHNLNEAIAEWRKTHDEEVVIEYLPYLLDPVEPGSKENFRARFEQRKGVPAAQVDQMFQRVTEAGKQAGIHFDFGKVEIAVDTVPGHELIALVPETKKAAVIEAIMKAYFEDGSAEAAIPPLKAVLSVMAFGSYEGKSIEDPEVRTLFDRDTVLQSDWYKERLERYKDQEIAYIERSMNYIQAYLAKGTNASSNAARRAQLEVQRAKVRLEALRNPSYMEIITGSIGKDPLYTLNK